MDFAIKAGKDENLSLVYKDADGAPINVTGFTAKLVFRRSMYAIESGSITGVIGNSDGKLTFPFTPADTGTLLAEKSEEEFVYAVEVTDTGNKKYDLLAGTLTIKQSAAR